jgi:hypothetical protein
MPSHDFTNTDCCTPAPTKPPYAGLALTGNILTICAGVLLVATAIMSMYRARKAT